MSTQRDFYVIFILLVSCTACWSLEAENKDIPYDTEAECKDTAGAEWDDTTMKCSCSSYYLPAPNRTMCLPRLANAAVSCEVSEQCADAMQFGECISAVCTCPENFHYLRHRCWPSSRLGQNCSRDEECHVNYDPLSAICSPEHEVCVCNEGYYSRGNSDCRREAKAPGDPCGLDNDCKFLGGACDSDNRVCYSTITTSVASTGGITTTQQIIAIANSDTNTTPTVNIKNKVKKSSNSHASATNANTNPSTSADTTANSNTNSNSGTSADSNTNNNANSSVNSNSNTNNNAKTSTSTNINTKTSAVTSTTTAAFTATSSPANLTVGTACDSNSSCSALVNSYCFGNRCECEPGSFGNNGDTICVREIGESCSSNEDCSGIDYSECRNNTCTCTVGYIATTYNRACKPAKKYANSCSPKFPEQCSDYGLWCECLDKLAGDGQQCRCTAHHHFVQEENLCWVSRGLNEKCRDDRDCVVDVGIAHCPSSTTCQCSTGLYLSHDGANCINVTAMGDKCATIEDCSGLGDNINCTSNKCSCKAHYYEGADSKGLKTCNPGLGAQCSSNSSCSRENTICVDNTCKCKEGYVSSTDGETCLEIAKRLEANCTENQQCTQSLGDLSLCESWRCVCGEDDQYRDGKCREKKAPGDQCQSSSECYVLNNVSFVECRNKVCQCKFGYHVSNNQECISSSATSRMVGSTTVLIWSLLAVMASRFT